ncbi:MAG TPA: ribokinase [Ilumatobacteraceae bacterium]|nr:ribokinase [Ilumatobacteraceae bacterium]
MPFDVDVRVDVLLDVAVVGSANLDLVANTPRLPKPGETVLGSHFAEHPGGKGLNQAVAAARAGASVAFVATVGDDDAGRTLRTIAEREGIDVTGVSVAPGAATGRAMITVDEFAENSIVVIPGANSLSRFSSLPAAAVVLAQLEVPVATVLAAFEAARSAGSTTVLNPAPVPADGLPHELLALCDVIVPNEHEAALLGGVDHLVAAGVGAVVVTRGAGGVTVTDVSDGVSRTIDAFDVDPIDTTGAGDAFCGTLAAQLASGADLYEAARTAAAAGALATTVAGAVPSLPFAAEIHRLAST